MSSSLEDELSRSRDSVSMEDTLDLEGEEEPPGIKLYQAQMRKNHPKMVERPKSQSLGNG